MVVSRLRCSLQSCCVLKKVLVCEGLRKSCCFLGWGGWQTSYLGRSVRRRRDAMHRELRRAFVWRAFLNRRNQETLKRIKQARLVCRDGWPAFSVDRGVLPFLTGVLPRNDETIRYKVSKKDANFSDRKGDVRTPELSSLLLNFVEASLLFVVVSR